MYVNEVTFRDHKLSLQICQSYKVKVLDLSKEVLWVSVGQLAVKLQAVKVGGVK